MKLGKPSNVRGSSWRCLLALVTTLLSTAPSTAGELRVASSILSPLRTSEVPAAEAGVLHQLTVREGDEITAGATIGLVDARRQQLLAGVARQDLAYARREAQSDVRIRLALSLIHI